MKEAKRKMPGQKATDKGGQSYPKKVVKAFLITLAIGIGTILLASLAAYFFPDPDPVIRPLALFAAAITAFIGGIVTGKIHGESPLMCGTLNGLLLLALMILASLPFQSLASGYSTWTSLLLHAAVPILSLVGAIIGTQKPAPRKRKRLKR